MLKLDVTIVLLLVGMALASAEISELDLDLAVDESVEAATASFPYSWTDLRKFLFYSYASYCFDNLQDWTCFWCLSKNVSGLYPQVNLSVPPVQVDVILESQGLYGTYGFTGVSKEAILVSFRGTDTVENWIKDFEFWMTAYPNVPGAEVHHGFYATYLAVMAPLRSSVQKLRKAQPTLPIIVTGHSLGGAQSVLAAVDLALLGHQNIRLITFGQPRVGNAVFANLTQNLISQHFRVVNMEDIVPHTPFLYGFL